MQLDLKPVDLGDAERLTPAEADALAERMRTHLVEAGFTVELGQDRADVDDATPDWELLTATERASGGFDYPELVVAGQAGMLVDVFLQSVFISTEPDFDAEQAATSQVLTALRSLAPLVEISDEDWREIERAAADRGVAADGSILRS